MTFCRSCLNLFFSHAPSLFKIFVFLTPSKNLSVKFLIYHAKLFSPAFKYILQLINPLPPFCRGRYDGSKSLFGCKVPCNVIIFLVFLSNSFSLINLPNLPHQLFTLQLQLPMCWQQWFYYFHSTLSSALILALLLLLLLLWENIALFMCFLPIYPRSIYTLWSVQFYWVYGSFSRMRIFISWVKYCLCQLATTMEFENTFSSWRYH